ncbi:MAG: response regulator transcription factor [Eubacteriales bacterium]|nr:response regulator transcription factor [Eubacteriales bacterium]
MYKVLIVEDEKVIADALAAHLSKWGYQAVCVSDFQDVLGIFETEQPHIVLMDIGLPFFNGYHWCTQIRKISKAPVIFLSSMSDNMNIVMAINMGGDDFITKPYDLNVVVAKIWALIRRTYDFTDNSNIIEHNGCVLNMNDQTFTYNTNKVELTRNEYRILQCLLENTGRVVSRDRIMEKLWEDEAFVDDNTLTVNITRLRKKLEDAGVKDYIKTKKGVGYIIS